MKRLPVYAFLAANAISMVGNVLTALAIPWFVLETTGSAAKTGLSGFFTALPAVIAGFLGGVLVDRLGYKRTSISADLASGVTVALVPLLYSTLGLQFWQLLSLVFLGALLDAPGNTARQALLPDIAQAAGMRLEQVNAAQQTIQRFAVLVGPVLAGLLITLLEASNVLWVDAATFAVSAAIFAVTIPETGQRAESSVPYMEQIKESWRFVGRDRLLLTLLLVVMTTNFLDSPLFAVVLPVYAQQLFGSATRLGLMISSFGAGAVIGTLGYGAIGQHLPRRGTFITCFLLLGLPFWLLAWQPSFPLIIGALFFTGLAAGPINPLLMTVSHERIPVAMRGRVFGILSAVALTATPLGIVLAGYLVEWLGVRGTLLIIASAYLAVTLAQFFNPALFLMDEKGGPASVT